MCYHAYRCINSLFSLGVTLLYSGISEFLLVDSNSLGLHFDYLPEMAGTFAPVLHTPRLTLTHSMAETQDELRFLLRVLNDPTAHERLGDMGVHTIPQLQALNEGTQLLPEHTPYKQSPGVPVFYIVHEGPNDPDGHRMGAISLCSRQPDIPPDIGWCFLGPDQGKGYATEAAKAVLSYLMKTFQGGFENAVPPIGIISFILEKNQPSVRVAKKIGLVPMGVFDVSPGGLHPVYGVEGIGINGGQPFSEKQKVNIWGPGDRGRRVQELIESGGTKWDPAVVDGKA